MKKAVCWGYCTSNENGLLEVNWEYKPSFFDKLLNRKTSFICEKKGNDWFEKESGKPIFDFQTINIIRSILIDLELKND